MNYLGIWDYVAFCCYFSVLIGIGIYLRKRASASLEDYFLGGNKIPWWAMGIAGMASWLDMAGTMIIVSFLYMLGPRGIFVEFRGGVGLPLAFAIIFTGKWHRRSNCMTAAEWMVYRFGPGPGGQFARIAVSLATIVGSVGMLAYLIKGAGLFLSMFVPFSPLICSLVLIAVATVYTMASGFYGVVCTDIFQSLIILTAVIIVTVMAVSGVHSTPDFGALAARVTGNTDWLSATPHFKTHMPAGYEAYHDLFMFAFFYFLRNFIGGFGSGGDPKYFGAKNERECGMLSFLWGWLLTFRWPLMIGFAILGILMTSRHFPDQGVPAKVTSAIHQYYGQVDKTHWPEVLAKIAYHPESSNPELTAEIKTLLGENWQTKLQMVSYEGTVDPERILPGVILLMIPGGIRGLIVIALVAAAMSSFNSTVNMTAGLFTRDIYQQLRPKAGNRELITATWAFIVLLAVIGYVSAYSIRSINDIWDWIAMSLGGGLLVPSILRFYWWRFNGMGVAVGLITGVGGAVIQRLVYPNLDVRMQFVVLSAVGLVGSIVGTYIGKPTDSAVLTRFYRMTRPFGFWGPMLKTLSPEMRHAMRREHRNDLLALPFMLTWMITLFMLPMMLMVGNYQAAAVIACILTVCLLGIYKFWYLNLPPEDKQKQTKEVHENVTVFQDEKAGSLH